MVSKPLVKEEVRRHVILGSDWAIAGTASVAAAAQASKTIVKFCLLSAYEICKLVLEKCHGIAYFIGKEHACIP